MVSTTYLSENVIFKDTYKKNDEYPQNQLDSKSTWMYLKCKRKCLLFHSCYYFYSFLEAQNEMKAKYLKVLNV